MRTRAQLLTALIALAPLGALTAQDVGQEAPDIQWTNTYNFDGIPSAKLSELRGSVVLLEFWGTH